MTGGAWSVSVGARRATSGRRGELFGLEESIVVCEEVESELVGDGRGYFSELQII